MIFNPASSDVAWDPEIMAAQAQLNQLSIPEAQTYSKGFFGGHESQGSWWTSALTGQLVSKIFDDESEKDWFIQRNSIDLVGQEINKELEAYNAIADARGLTQLEYDHVSDLISRRDMIDRDLGLVFDKLGGDMDAPLDSDGKSFNERWNMSKDDEQGFWEIMKILKDNPSYTAGVLSAELIKDLPMLVVATLAGKTYAPLSIGAITTKVAAKLQGIKPIALKGLKIPLRGAAQLGTGVGVGAGAGAGYEAAYSLAEQGTIKSDDVWMGAKFGAVFGVLGGAGLHYKGRKLDVDVDVDKNIEPRNKVIGAAQQAGKAIPVFGAAAEISAATGGAKSAAKSAAEKASSKLKLDSIRKIGDEAGDESTSSQAQESSILIDIPHDINIVKGKKGDTGPALVTTSDLEGRIKTEINEFKLELEHKRLLKELDEAFAKSTPFRGTDRCLPIHAYS